MCADAAVNPKGGSRSRLVHIRVIHVSVMGHQQLDPGGLKNYRNHWLAAVKVESSRNYFTSSTPSTIQWR